jgi:hypothetical protein
MATKIVQPPNALVDYELDWAKFLDTDTIDTSDLAVDDAALIVTDGGLSDTTTTIWVDTRGTEEVQVELGQTYEVANHIVTTGGREWVGIIKVQIKKIYIPIPDPT